MALLFIDGFDNYGVTADLIKKWATNTDAAAVTFNGSAGRFGGGCLHITANTGALTRSLPNSSTVVAGFWHKVGSAGAMQQDDMLRFMQSGGGSAYGVYCKIEGDGSITLFANDDATAKATSVNKLLANVGYFIECKAICADSGTGLVEVRVNGAVWATYSGDTYVGATGASFGTIELKGQHLADSYIDDFWVLDDSGSINTDYLGDMRIETLSVTADSAVTQDWTPLTGPDLYTEVDETNAGDDDTSYVSSSTVGATSRFELADLSAVPSFVAGVQINHRAKKTDAGTRDYRVFVKSGATTLNQATQSLNTDYLTYVELVEANPDTGGVWSQAAIDALEIGIELIA